MRVTAPNPEYTGRVGKDAFANGVCEDASESQRSYYERKGYIIDGEKPENEPVTPTDPPVRPADDAGRADVVAYARAIGVEPQGLKVEEIWEVIREREADAPVVTVEGENPHTTGVDDTATVEDRSGWKKSEWVTHASGLGIDVDGLTVEQLKAAVADHEANDTE